MSRIHRQRGAGRELAGAALLDDRLRLISQPITDLRTQKLVAEEIVPMIARSPAPGASAALCLERRGAGPADIDAWLVRRAAYLAAAGRPVHVGISGRSAVTGGFATTAVRAIERAGADPRLLTFEIDEAVAARETPRAERLTRSLTGLGSRVAINDFALRYRVDHLGDLHATVLKVDPWVIGDALNDERTAVLLDDIVAVARIFGMQTIAEGVYDRALAAVMHEGGIDCAQGFYRQRYFR